MRWRWILVALLALIGIGGGWFFYARPDQAKQSLSAIGQRIRDWSRGPQIDPNLAEGAGRIEAQEFDIASKNGGRVVSITVEEGDWVEKGAIVASMDRREIEATLRRANAEVLQAEQGLAQADAAVAQRQSDVALADAELKRAVSLRDRQYLSGAAYDQKKALHDGAEAALLLAKAQQRAAKAGIDVAKSELDRLTVLLNETEISSPKPGRVLYKLVEAGAVVSPGQRLATLLDMSDVYLTIFLPMEQAGRLTIGQEASVTLDALPDRPMPARVDFLSPRAQFTPKTVETRDERTKFMFRVKIRITDPRDVPLNPGLPAVARIRLVGPAVSAQP
jgi:HlyD family secretion protein